MSKHSSTVGLVCRDNFGLVQHIYKKAIGDCLVLVAEIWRLKRQFNYYPEATIWCHNKEWLLDSDSHYYGWYYNSNSYLTLFMTLEVSIKKVRNLQSLYILINLLISLLIWLVERSINVPLKRWCFIIK